MSGRKPTFSASSAVLLGPVDQRGEAVLGQPRGAIVRDAAHDLAIAAPDQHVGHRLGDAGAAGNRQQVRLALGLGDVDQIGFGEPARLLQHRAGDRDVVVLGEPPHHLDRRIADRREAIGQLRARLGLDLGDQAAEHVVEQADVVVVELARRRQEECGDALERLGAPLGRSRVWMTSSSSGISDAGAAILKSSNSTGGIGKAAVGTQARSGFEERLVNDTDAESDSRQWVTEPAIRHQRRQHPTLATEGARKSLYFGCPLLDIS